MMANFTVYRVEIFNENSLSAVKIFETKELAAQYIQAYKDNIAKHLAEKLVWRKNGDGVEYFETTRLYTNIKITSETMES
tara:strand:- start:5315 stop:5554 length:240 start_codon:yes stop_codon:yes gene_type:complete